MSNNDKIPQNKEACPLCGQPNLCSPTSGKCWCMGLPVSKEKLEASTGKFSMDKICLCRTCIEQFMSKSQ